MTKKKSCCPRWLCWLSVLLIVAAVVIAFVVSKKIAEGNSTFGDNPKDINKKYKDALEVALQFFDVQKSGKLENNKISWRGDSGLKDGSQVKLDLSKGLYDAGDSMKFGFPMAFTATVLSWGILEYGDQMAAVHQLDTARESLRWITDYLINAHPSENVLYIQVGDTDKVHQCWERPESMKDDVRQLTQVNTSKPGSDVAAETAAAMASASLVFKKSDSSYADTLLKHARQLFTFADKYRECYSVSIPKVQKFYNSTDYGDDLLWAAGWLYHATGDNKYLQYVEDNGESFGHFEKISWFSWDNKHAGVQVLLSRSIFIQGEQASRESLQDYKRTAETVMCALLPDSPSATEDRTPEGLIWISEWNCLQHAVSSAFLATLYSDYMRTSKTTEITCDESTYTSNDLRSFAKSQLEYVLGNNPMKMSYLVGYGDQYPKYVHHRGASIPKDAETGCKDGFKWLESKKPNPNIAVGGLVGGPYKNDSYVDARDNYAQAEPNTYNTALLVSLLSGLVSTSSVEKTLSEGSLS